MKQTTDTLFILDDEAELCGTLQKVLEAEGYKVLWSTNPDDFLSENKNNRFACLLLDLRIGGLCGLDILEKIRTADPHLPVIMITAFDTVKTAVEAMKKGAFHYLPKPFDNEELKALVSKAVEVRHLYWQLEAYQNETRGEGRLELKMGHSEKIGELTRQIRAVAATQVNVLLTGESGTGKEMAAQAIHAMSTKKEGPFVPVDCASIPETLIESELFGHERGAFTGAVASQKGKLEQAGGGTLFLDEISNVTLPVQAKLLRFLETRSFERVGGRRSISVSLRVIAATNRELPLLIKNGSFREDLFHRLNEFPIALPPLRERPEDISYLGLKFLREFEEDVGKSVAGISPGAITTLQNYPWPGNVRELRNVIKRAMVVASGKIEKADIPAEIRDPAKAQIQKEMTIPLRLDLPLLSASKEAARFIEQELIRSALRRSEGRKGKAAKLLKVDEKTLYNKLKEYKIS